MFDVRRWKVKLVLSSLATCLLAGALVPATAQTENEKKKKKHESQESQALRETNATRLARIRHDTEQTYSYRYEIIGGGGLLRFRSGEFLQRNNEITWASAFNYYLNRRLALVGDARGSFGNARAYTGITNPYGVYRPQINEYMFMGGVSYRFYAKEKYAVSVQALGGDVWGVFSGGSKGIPSTLIGLWRSDQRPVFSGGVSLDYNLTPNWAARFTPTWVGTNFIGPTGAGIQSNLGFNIGVLYRFGHR
jgi:hypothetical protein